LDHGWTLAAASLAVLLGAINLAGGFFVTHRMLSMFVVKKKTNKPSKP
jgi:NAD/NADP transhydrogenase alpha subunit